MAREREKCGQERDVYRTAKVFRIVSLSIIGTMEKDDPNGNERPCESTFVFHKDLFFDGGGSSRQDSLRVVSRYRTLVSRF